MDETLKNCLRENERVRWQGAPADFSLLDSVNRRPILIKWMLTAVLTAALLTVYLAGRESPSMGFVGLVALTAVLILASPLEERWSLRQQQYWITDQRAIVMTRDKSLYCMELDALDDFRLVRDQAPESCLVLGGSILSESGRQLRWRACHPKIDLRSQSGQDGVQGMVFYCVRNAADAERLLRRGPDGSAA